MIKEAKTIPLRDRETICGMKRDFEGKPFEDQLFSLKAEFRSVTNGIYARLLKLEEENHDLRRRMLLMEMGRSTYAEETADA